MKITKNNHVRYCEEQQWPYWQSQGWQKDNGEVRAVLRAPKSKDSVEAPADGDTVSPEEVVNDELKGD